MIRGFKGREIKKKRYNFSLFEAACLGSNVVFEFKDGRS